MLKIAIVDDEERIRLGLSKIIRKASAQYEVVGSYTNGMEALQALTDLEVHVVITDIQMPALNGLELIEQLKKIKPSLAFIVLSGYSEFEYARQALRFGVSEYLLKPVNKQELYGALERLHEAIRTEQLRQQNEQAESLKKLLDIQGSVEEAEKAIRHLPQDLLAKPVTVLCVKSDLPMERKAVETWEKEQCASSFFKVLMFSEWEACVVCTHEPMTEQERYEKSAGLAESLMSRLSGILSAGIGPAVSDCFKLGDAYQEAIRACDYAIYSPYRTQTVGSKELPAAPASIAIGKLEKRMKSSLDLLDIHKIREELQAAFVEMAQMKAEKKRVIEACSKWIYFIQHEVPEFHEAATLHFGQDISVETLLLRHLRFHDIQNQMVRLVTETLTLVKDTRDGSKSRVIDKIKRIIAEQYRNDIELPRLADQVYLTPSYLSKYFKSETGQTLTEYLISIRIEKAKELLKHHAEMKSYEVGDLVGYPDPAYFNKLFKRIVGLTPKEYKDKVRLP
ncbi:response regulator transcription factor [Paenibacillus sp. OAS669]|uniref:response regulator transcription factor n=1 Tax=Paenibacillus sp. OAS669 TaxID=2663821 RepID=UPI00178908FE|nr:response regulator [Paenibacillus sp. OAS669]MBE1440815.1 two-component system response regulator YesN [Paenibacillus sp. OAS669]